MQVLHRPLHSRARSFSHPMSRIHHEPYTVTTGDLPRVQGSVHSSILLIVAGTKSPTAHHSKAHMHAGPTLSATPATSRATQRGRTGALSVAGGGDGPRRPLRPTSAPLPPAVRLAAELHDQRVDEQQRHLEAVHRHASLDGEMRAQRARVGEVVRAAPTALHWPTARALLLAWLYSAWASLLGLDCSVPQTPRLTGTI